MKLSEELRMKGYNNLTWAERLAAKDLNSGAECRLTASQIEAWLFVKRIDLAGLWNQPVGMGREVLASIDWVSRMMPPVPAVYFLCVEDVTGIMPVYIGMTSAGLDKRIGPNHGFCMKTATEYRDSFVALRYIPISEAMDLRDIEAAAISYWNPPLNTQKPMPPKKEVEAYIAELKSILA